MTEVTAPRPLTPAFARALQATAADFVTRDGEHVGITQHGAAALNSLDFPGWPDGLTASEAIIETFVGDKGSVTAMGDHEPFVSAWGPLADWMNTTVRSQLAVHDVEVDGQAYVTASLTLTTELEGVAHMDDDIFTPTKSVGMVAIIGELTGPRVTTGTLDHPRLPPMGQVVFGDSQLQACAGDEVDHCRCDANQLVVFPQFAQLHAGPAADHVAHLSPTRQLLVMRASVKPTA